MPTKQCWSHKLVLDRDYNKKAFMLIMEVCICLQEKDIFFQRKTY